MTGYGDDWVTRKRIHTSIHDIPTSDRRFCSTEAASLVKWGPSRSLRTWSYLSNLCIISHLQSHCQGFENHMPASIVVTLHHFSVQVNFALNHHTIIAAIFVRAFLVSDNFETATAVNEHLPESTSLISARISPSTTPLQKELSCYGHFAFPMRHLHPPFQCSQDCHNCSTHFRNLKYLV